MGQILEFLVSESGLSLLAWALGFLFSVIFSSDKVLKYVKEQKIERLKKAYQYLEAAVVQQRDLVDKMKKDNGGKLSEEQKKFLEEQVVSNLKQASINTGIDFISIIGPDLIQPAITYTVKKIKSKVGIQDKSLPVDVEKLFS